ncbi:MAG: response regulator [Elusimicrobiota bacterium]
MVKKILIVDDEIEFIGFLIDRLKGYGYTVVAVDSGKKAVALAKSGFYDLFLIDINMPEMDGLEVFEKIKEVSALSSVVMMTAAAPESMVKKALENGAFAVVHKPYELKKLIPVIDGAMKEPTVLIIDDSISDREKLKNMLVEKKYKVVVAEDAETALKILSQVEIDIVFIDIVMPNEDGFSVLKKIKSIYPSIGAIMMTSYTDIEYTEIALKRGAYTCLHKPLNIETIVGITEKLHQDRIQLHKKLRSILLVEDDIAIAQSLKDVLQSEEYKVQCVATGADAIAESKKAMYSAVIIDFKLPDMTGIEVTKKIKEINHDITIIVITGYEDIEILLSALKEHVFDFFIKPIDPQKLIESLMRAELLKS